MTRKYLSIVCFSTALLLLSACSGETSPQVQAMQRKDKQLSCKEVLLEMNEAQFYKKMAQKNKDPKLKTVLMPLGYISTYMGADEAIETASARVDYLDKIYDIMDCENAPAAAGYQQPVSSYQPRSTAPSYVGTNYAAPTSGAYRAPTEPPITYYQDNRGVASQPPQYAPEYSQNNGNSKRYW